MIIHVVTAFKKECSTCNHLCGDPEVLQRCLIVLLSPNWIIGDFSNRRHPATSDNLVH